MMNIIIILILNLLINLETQINLQAWSSVMCTDAYPQNQNKEMRLIPALTRSAVLSSASSSITYFIERAPGRHSEGCRSPHSANDFITPMRPATSRRGTTLHSPHSLYYDTHKTTQVRDLRRLQT